MITALRRALALAKVRRLEIHLDGINEAMQYANDEETRIAISMARYRIRKDLALARAAYIKLLPPGERRTWGAA